MKTKKTTLLALTLAGVLTVGAAAAGIQRITAELRPDVSVVVDGKTQTLVDKNGDRVEPIMYEGSTYLPVRAVADAVGVGVRWDSKTQTVYLTTGEATPEEPETVDALETRMTALEKQISGLTPAGDYAGRAKQYADYRAKLDAFEDAADLARDDARDAYISGKTTYSAYAALLTRFDKLDTRLDAAAEALEAKTIAKDDDKLTAAERHDKTLDALESRYASLKTEIRDLKSASGSDARIKQYRALSDKLETLSADVTAAGRAVNASLRGDALTYSEYNKLTARIDTMDTGIKELRITLEDKTIAGEDTPSASQGDYAKRLDALEARVEKQERAAQNYKPAQGKNENKQAYRAVQREIDTLDDELDRMEDEIERAYKDGKLSASDYRALDARADRLDDRLGDAEDRLERAAGFDDDDD